ncbi:MAG: uridine kinase [Burkholderiaceae bacterium]|nr:uridine kinase [Microbacteriaceae bacterium]
MTRWKPERHVTLDTLAAEILHNYGSGRATVAIDGIDGSGKTRFAEHLAAAVTKAGHGVATATVDAFYRPAAERYRLGHDSVDGCYRESYDYATFRRVLVEPFLAGDAFQVASFDVHADAPISPPREEAPIDCLLIVDGVYLNRPELRGLWNYSVWLEVPLELGLAQHTSRDGTDPSIDANLRYAGAQEVYIGEADPRGRATAIIDNSDVNHPLRVFADAC